MDRDQLIEAALVAREKAWAPYSNFRVGAALLAESGKVYVGCNVEISSLGLTMCAERVALFKAISEGERAFRQVVVVADCNEPCPPCGACRQALWDFAPELDVIMRNVSGDEERVKLSSLYAKPFGPGSF